VLTSNIFAILGLRAMYFLLAAVAAKFHLLSYGLAVILVFIGSKMLLVDVIKIPVLLSLGVVVGILAVTMVWSVKTAPRLVGGAARAVRVRAPDHRPACEAAVAAACARQASSCFSHSVQSYGPLS